MTTTTRTDLDPAETDRTATPCRVTWCDRTCSWASDPNHDVIRVHQRSVDGYTLSVQETVSGGLDQPIIAFPTVGHLTADEAHAHLSTVRYLLSLVERDTRNRTGR